MRFFVSWSANSDQHSPASQRPAPHKQTDGPASQAQILLAWLASASSKDKRAFSMYAPEVLPRHDAPLEKKRMTVGDSLTLFVTLTKRLNLMLFGYQGNPKSPANLRLALQDTLNLFQAVAMALISTDDASIVGVVEDSLDGAQEGQFTARFNDTLTMLPASYRQMRPPLPSTAKPQRGNARPGRGRKTSGYRRSTTNNRAQTPANAPAITSSYCRNWNDGRACSLRNGEAKCPRVHACSVCQSPQHSRINCPKGKN